MAYNTEFVLWLLLLSGWSACFGSGHDIQCLKTVQQSVIDPYGRLKSSWIFDGKRASSICEFTGVLCWNDGEDNKVHTLNLSNLGLQGQFPRGLQNFSSMVILDLSNNNFSGEIPSDISWQLPFLTNLDLSYNNFSGKIAVVSNMLYLNSLSLQHNRLSGEILWDSKSSFLQRLTDFNVSDNQLSGPIPLPLMKFPASSFAGNQGLCGAPLLTECGSGSKWRLRLHRINDESSIGAAAGFVVGFVVAFYFPHLFVFSQKLHPYIVHIY